MPKKTKKPAAPATTEKTAWLVEFGMLDRQRADVVVLTDGDRPTDEQLSDAYEALDGSEFNFDQDFSPDEGTHYVLRQMTDQSAIESYPRVDITGEFAEYEAAKPVGPPPEVWYTWRQLVDMKDEEKPRLLVPWSEKHSPHEHSFDFLFKTPEDAMQGLIDFGAVPNPEYDEVVEGQKNESDDWILCKMTVEPVPRPK